MARSIISLDLFLARRAGRSVFLEDVCEYSNSALPREGKEKFLLYPLYFDEVEGASSGYAPGEINKSFAFSLPLCVSLMALCTRVAARWKDPVHGEEE